MARFSLPFVYYGERDVRAVEWDTYDGSTPSGEDQALARASVAMLDRTGLTELQEEALRLRFYEGLEYPDIAEHFGISASGAKQIVYRALANLRRNN